MDDQLRSIITTIEQSSLSVEQKDLLYTEISRTLHNLVLPILARHLPQNELDTLSQNLHNVTPQKYLELIKPVLTKPKVLSEIEQNVKNYLNLVTATLNS